MARQLSKPWYNSFVDCTLPHTEAPQRYLFWSAISVLGGILKNNVFFKDGLYTLYPNQYIILTGPPGIGKGTAINFAWKLIKTQISPLANVLTDKITGPKILHLIADGWATAPVLVNGQVLLATKEHTCTIIASELQSMMSGSDDMLSTFCQLWDQYEYEYRTKNQGSAIIKDMCISLIGGTVPDYVRGMERDVNAAIAGGFTARCIFIFEDKKSKELPYAPTIDEVSGSKILYDKLKEDLQHISRIKGEYKLNDDAKIEFRKFYPEITPLGEDSDAILNFKARMRTHIYKMAMILAAARKDDLVITGQDIKDSIFLIKSVRRNLDKVFRGIGSSQLAEPTAKVQNYIERVGMCTKTELIKAMHRHMECPGTLDRVLYVLETIGFCTEQKIGNKVYFTHIPKIVQGINGKGNP